MRALELGATEVVVVLTSPIEARAEKKRLFPGTERLFSSSPAIRRALRERHLRYCEAANVLDAPPEGVSIRVVRPTRALPVKRTTTDHDLLEQARRTT